MTISRYLVWVCAAIFVGLFLYSNCRELQWTHFLKEITLPQVSQKLPKQFNLPAGRKSTPQESPKKPKQLDPHICLVTMADDRYRKKYETYIETHKCYAKRHKYTYAVDYIQLYPNNKYQITIRKLDIIYNWWKSGKCDWVFWIDADMVIVDKKRPLTEFLPDNAVLVAKDDSTIIDNGLFAVNSNASHPFYEKVENFMNTWRDIEFKEGGGYWSTDNVSFNEAILRTWTLDYKPWKCRFKGHEFIGKYKRCIDVILLDNFGTIATSAPGSFNGKVSFRGENGLALFMPNKAFNLRKTADTIVPPINGQAQSFSAHTKNVERLEYQKRREKKIHVEYSSCQSIYKARESAQVQHGCRDIPLSQRVVLPNAEHLRGRSCEQIFDDGLCSEDWYQWCSKTCKVCKVIRPKRERVVVVIPTFNRAEDTFHIVQKLMKHSMPHHGLLPDIFVVELVENWNKWYQEDTWNIAWNKGRLLNAAISEIRKRSHISNSTKIVFHDNDVFECCPGVLNYHDAVANCVNQTAQQIYGFNPDSLWQFYNLDDVPEDEPINSEGIKIRDRFGHVNCMGGIFCIPYEAFVEVDGFSNMFTKWGHEDVDFGWRLTEKNISISADYNTGVNDPSTYPCVSYKQHGPGDDEKVLRNIPLLRTHSRGFSAVSYRMVESLPVHRSESLGNLTVLKVMF